MWQDVLTYLSEEEFWGLEFFHYPTDFFSVEVVELYALKTPLKAEAVFRSLSRGPDGLVRVTRPESFVISSVLTSQVLFFFLAFGRCRTEARSLHEHKQSERHLYKDPVGPSKLANQN